MRILTLLRVVTVGSCVIGAVIVLALAYVSVSLQQSDRAQAVADHLQQRVFALAAASGDYLLLREEWARSEWLARHESLGMAIEKAEAVGVLDSSEMRSLRQAYDVAGSTFHNLIELAPSQAMSGSAMNADRRLMANVLSRVREMEAITKRVHLRYRAAFEQSLYAAVVIFLVAVGAALVALVGSWAAVYQRLGRPLAEISAGIGSISRGEYRQQIKVRRNDEMGEIAIALNALSETLSLTMVSRNQLLWEAELRSKSEAETQRLNGELEKAIADLGRSNKELEEFAYVASHDLQEPLRATSSYAKLLGRRYQGLLDEKADHYLKHCLEGCDRMQRMINDLLTYSRVSSRWIEPVVTDSVEALKAAIGNLTAQLEEAGATVNHFDLPVVLASFDALTRLFQNLIENAIKYRSAPAPIIDVEASRDGEMWLFAVRDNGIGIDPAYHERIFSIFQRLHTRQEYDGTGIGLAICRRIAERHGGRIWVASEEGGGATFYFTLPDAGAQPTPEGTKQNES